MDKKGKVLQKVRSNNRQVQRTKSWIFDALMFLMDEKPYNKISVSDITEKAGIARQTFYRNYGDKEDVLFEYVQKTIQTDIVRIEANQNCIKQDEISLIFNYNYIIKHRDTLKKILSTAEIENRIFLRGFHEQQEWMFSLIQSFKDKLSQEQYLICRYKICYQIAGCLRAFLDWFINDMPLPVDAFVSMLNAMNIPKVAVYQNIPNIIIRANKE